MVYACTICGQVGDCWHRPEDRERMQPWRARMIARRPSPRVSPAPASSPAIVYGAPNPRYYAPEEVLARLPLRDA